MRINTVSCNISDFGLEISDKGSPVFRNRMLFASGLHFLAYCLFSSLPAAAFRILFLLCVFASLQLTAAENEQRVPSTISNVTVFLNQAQVTRVAKVNLQAGVTNLVFDKVSPFINLNSIQVKTENNVVLLSVSQRNNYIEKEEKPGFIKEIEDTLQALNNQLQLLHIKREALQMEKDVLQANKKIGGDNSGVKVEDLEDALQLFRKRTAEIGEELLKLTYSEQKLNLIKQKFQLQLDEYNSNENSTAEIVVTVKTLVAVANAKIEWSYLVTNASWKPFYDVRVKDTKSELQLVSKAYITQGTGESWKNVILKLSTSNPNESGSKPELQTNYLAYGTPIALYDKSNIKLQEVVISKRKPLT
ncbi:MAG: mucoidy inhibitor MuiA family protein, partial [Bacteroidota bacterium]